jgi:hypothetical protein
VANGQRSLGERRSFQWFRGSLERRSQQSGRPRERVLVGSKSRTGTSRGACSQVVRWGHRDIVDDPGTCDNARQLGLIDLPTWYESFVWLQSGSVGSAQTEGVGVPVVRAVGAGLSRLMNG